MTDTPPRDKTGIAGQMRLRAPPQPVMRLSRKALIIIGGASALALAAALGFALLKVPARDAKPELYRVGGPPPEQLQSLPSDYSGRGASRHVPQLGPPLPGDLGGPILAAQQDGVAVPAPTIGSPSSAPSPAQTAAEVARQKRLAEHEQARTSTLFLQAGNGRAAPPSAAQINSISTSAAPPTPPVSAKLVRPGSPYTVQAGAIISGALVTGLRSDLPGQTIGQVTADVYDSVTGRHLLIPRGSRLLGTYDAGIAFGQSRVLLVWKRLILPNGASIDLEDQTASDAQGFAGLQDQTDNRWGERLRTAGLTTLLAIGSAAGDGAGDDAVARALSRGTTDGVNTLGAGLVEKGLSVAPRLTIRPGFEFRLIVAHDLVLEPYGAN